MPVLTTILHCTTCGCVVEDIDYEANVKRIKEVPFPGAVEAVKCPKHRSTVYPKASTS